MNERFFEHKFYVCTKEANLPRKRIKKEINIDIYLQVIFILGK